MKSFSVFFVGTFLLKELIFGFLIIAINKGNVGQWVVWVYKELVNQNLVLSWRN
jgi:hypothetical protein